METYKGRYFVPEELHWDRRIIPVKSLITKDGSEELFALLVSPINTWESENDFIDALNLLDGQNIDSERATENKFVAQKLNWFNEYMSKYITIMPDYRSEKKVLSDVWNCQAVMWKECENYVAYFWQTTA